MRLIRTLLLSLCLLPLAVAAEVYKYTDEKGVVHYSDKPPGKGAKPANLPPLHTYSPLATTPKPESTTASPAAAGGDFSLRVIAPEPDQTYRDPLGTVGISVAVTPEIPGGHGLIYFVDGAPVSGDPVTATSFTASGVERGQHTVEVSLVDGDGQEVARSAPVTIHLKQPIAKPRPAPPKPAK